MLTFSIMLPTSIQQKYEGLITSNSFREQDVFLKYKSKLLSSGQGYLDLPNDLEAIEKVKTLAGKILKNSYQHYIILGIGGSMLGVQTIIDSLASSYTKSKFIFLDNIDPYQISEIVEQIDLKSSLFLVQSKSGQTPETIAQYVFFRKLLEDFNLPIEQHMIFVTDPEKGYLRHIAKSENIPTLDIPKNVGGRFSVLTPVGLLSASIAGLNLEELLSGAKYLLEENLNSAYQLAVQQYVFLQLGCNINVIMPYSSRLRSFADWSVQLISESLGKRFDNEGKEVFAGITPLPAIGATDQHSQLQLFKEGPKDKLVICIMVQNHQSDVKISKINDPELDYLSDKTFTELLHAELHATSQSLYESDRPVATIRIEKVDEFHLGGLFMLFELATAFLGEFMNINTFDQPGVERGKILTKEILNQLN